MISAAMAVMAACTVDPDVTVNWNGDSFGYSVWRGEKCSATLDICAESGLEMKVRAFGLKSASGKISADAVSVFEMCPVMGDALNTESFGQCGSRKKEEWDSLYVADRLVPCDVLKLEDGGSRSLWVSVKVPADAAPGVYNGKLCFAAGRAKSIAEYSIEVVDRVLPEPSEWDFHLDLWQNPYSEARFHNAALWSDEHFALMKPDMELLASAGQKAITTTIMDRPWNGQTEDAFGSMVVKTKHSDGTWTYDYSAFDSWVEFMLSIGIDRQISCYTMIPWELTFDYVDADSGETRYFKADPQSEEYASYWVPFLKDFSCHLREKGWFDRTHIAMDERPMESMLAALDVIKTADPEFKVAYAGLYHPEIEESLDDFAVTTLNDMPDSIISRRRSEGKNTSFYTCCAERFPNSFIVSDPFECAWFGIYALAHDFDGYLRWAYNSWTADPENDARFRSWPAGDCYIVYPDGCSSVRFECAIDGIQCREKGRILINEWKDAGDTAKLAAMSDVLAMFEVRPYEFQDAKAPVIAFKELVTAE